MNSKLAQIFTPDPTKGTTLTIPPGGASVTWTIPNNVKIYSFFASCDVKETFNADVNGFTHSAESIVGPWGISSKTTSIKFTDIGIGGGTVVVRCM